MPYTFSPSHTCRLQWWLSDRKNWLPLSLFCLAAIFMFLLRYKSLILFCMAIFVHLQLGKNKKQKQSKVWTIDQNVLWSTHQSLYIRSIHIWLSCHVSVRRTAESSPVRATASYFPSTWVFPIEPCKPKVACTVLSYMHNSFCFLVRNDKELPAKHWSLYFWSRCDDNYFHLILGTSYEVHAHEA